MALIQCSDCGGQISQAARSCTHCGAPNYHRRAVRIRGLVMVAVGVFAVVIACLVFYGATAQARADRAMRQISQDQADVQWSRLRQIAIDAKAQEDATAATPAK